MPLESIWADVLDEEPVKKQKPIHRRNNDNKNNNNNNNRRNSDNKPNNNKRDTETKTNHNKRNNETKTKNKIKDTPARQKNPPRNQGKTSTTNEPLTVNPFSQKTTEVPPPPVSPSKNKPAKTKSKLMPLQR